MSSDGEAASTVTSSIIASATSLATGDNGCVICPTQVAVCPACATNQVCILSLQTCDSCAQVICADMDSGSSSSAAAAAGDASSTSVVSSAAAAAATPTTTPTPHIYHSASSSSAIDTGGIIGLVVGLGCFACLVLLSLWYWLYYKPKRQKMAGVEKLAGDENEHQQLQQQQSDRQSVYSVASSVLTRASNIIPIAYIPGQQQRPHHQIRNLSNAPPVPSIPADLYQDANVVHAQSGAKRVSFKDNNNNNDKRLPATTKMMPPPSNVRNTMSSSRPSSTTSDWTRASIYTTPDYIVPGRPTVVNLDPNNNNTTTTDPVPPLPNGDLLVDLSELHQVDEEQEQEQEQEQHENTHLIDSEIDSSRLSLGFTHLD